MSWTEGSGKRCRVTAHALRHGHGVHSLKSGIDIRTVQKHLGHAKLEIYRDEATGRETSRNGYSEMIQGVEDGIHETVVVHDISRLARSLRNLEDTVNQITDANVEVHFVDDRLTFGGDECPQSRLMLQMLGVFAEFEAAILRDRTRQGIAAQQAEDDYHHGRPPFGFEKEDGTLFPADNHAKICAMLARVAKGNLSKRQAAKDLDTSRSTINRCLERRELYDFR